MLMPVTFFEKLLGIFLYISICYFIYIYINIYKLWIYLMNYDAMYFYIVSSFSLSKQSLFYSLSERVPYVGDTIQRD